MKKETKDISSIINEILSSPEKNFEFNGQKVNAAEAIVSTMVKKAIEGDMRAIQWLTKVGKLDRDYDESLYISIPKIS